MKDNYCVYMHISPDNKFYIGITQQKVKLRWRNGKGYKKNLYFWRAIQKYGWDNFRHVVLFSGISEQEAKDKEVELIKKYQSNDKKFGFNLDAGGNSGHRFSKESREKMSVSSTGKKHTEETKQKISIGGKGLKKSLETIEKMKKAWTGEKNHRYGTIPKNAKRVEQLSLSNKAIAIFISSNQAEKLTGIKARSIRKVCCGERNTTGGFRWRYV